MEVRAAECTEVLPMTELYEVTVWFCLRTQSAAASQCESRAAFQSGQALHSVLLSIGPQTGRLRNAWDCLCWNAVTVVLTHFLITGTTLDSYAEQNSISSSRCVSTKRIIQTHCREHLQ